MTAGERMQVRCPRCGSNNVDQTTIGGLRPDGAALAYDDANTATCQACRHSGKVGDWQRLMDAEAGEPVPLSAPGAMVLWRLERQDLGRQVTADASGQLHAGISSQIYLTPYIANGNKVAMAVPKQVKTVSMRVSVPEAAATPESRSRAEAQSLADCLLHSMRK